VRAKRGRVGALALALVLLGATSGCGLVGGGHHAGFVESMLGQVPDSAATRSEVLVSDHAGARKLAGIAQPPHDVTDKSFGHYNRLFASTPKRRSKALAVNIQLFERGSQVAEFRRELGFSMVDADQVLQAGSPPNVIEIVRGRHIDPDEINHAVHADPAWKGDLTERSHDGERYYRWLADNKLEIKLRSTARPIGESARLAVDGHQIRWARSDEVVEGSIDAGHGKSKSLAGDDSMRSLARTLDDREVYNAFLTGDPKRFEVDPLLLVRRRRIPIGSTSMNRLLEEARKHALQPWEALAVGDAVVDGKPLGVIVIANRDGATAKSNARRLRQTLEHGSSAVTGEPYRNMLPVHSVTSRGNLVVALVNERLPTMLFRSAFQGDTLFAHT